MKLDGFSRKPLGGSSSGASALTIVSISSGSTPVVYGTLTNSNGTISGVTIHVFLDSVENGTVMTASDGSWSYPFVLVGSGSHTVTATATILINASEVDFTGGSSYELDLFDLSDFRNTIGL